MGGDDPPDHDARRHSERDRRIPEPHHEGPFFFRIDCRDHRRPAWGVSGFPDPDDGPGCEELAEILGESAGRRGQAPQHGHDADGFSPAPAVDHDRRGKRAQKDGPVHGGNQRPALGIGETPFRLQKGEQGYDDHSVDIVKEIEKPEQDKNIRRIGFGEEITFRGGGLRHGGVSINGFGPNRIHSFKR